MARSGLSERRAALVGLGAALALVVTQLTVGVAWSLARDDPSELELTRRCFEREKGLAVEPVDDDLVARSARGGALRTVVEGNLVTLSVATSAEEVERLRSAYLAVGDPGARLDVRGKYVALWLRDPSPTQRQGTYDCAY